MIITQLYGGLGNQLFQYAIGRAVANRRGTILKLDTSKFEAYSLRKYALDAFAITATKLTTDEARRLAIPPTHVSLIPGFIGKLFHRPALAVVRERSFAFDPAVLDAPADCYLEGYWQSPKYFASVENEIRKEFSFREPLIGANAELRREMSRSVAVSVHVRRGDYASNPVTAHYHGTSAPGYYVAAEDLLRRRIGEFRLFIFSDDPDWCEVNLTFKSPASIVRQNGPHQDYLDLHLMSRCQHHILANSTFGWWGAWLCPNPDKIVIAPKIWFREPHMSADDLIPETWLRL
jgi:hypothetical protein